MECRYCQTANGRDDHRCRRCGRRLTGATPYTASAAAPALEHDFSPDPFTDRAVYQPKVDAPKTPARPVTYQPSLFSSRELPRVVPFESIAPAVNPAALHHKPLASPRPRHRKIIPGQQSLAFSPARSHRSSEGVIGCDVPVAVPIHRALAAALDTSLVLIALAVFGLVFHLAGGQIVLNTKTVPMFLAVAAAVVLGYKLVWCLGGGDTPGMSWTRLTLVDFDGQRPDRKQRICRLTSGCLSVLAGAMGLIWALVDEETLTWHDHISRTFPTPY